MFPDPLSVYLLELAMTFNDYSHDSVDPPRLPNFDLHSEKPDSAVFPVKEVQQAVVLD